MIDLTGKNFFQIKDNFKVYDDVESRLLYGVRKQTPKVSIMIPTFVRNDYLIETINSALNQNTKIDYEVVVVDNNPDMDDKDTLNLIRNYDSNRISYYKNGKNIGMFGNWNRCIELSNAKWMLILHDDDTITSDYISRMTDIVRKYPDCSCVGCGNTLIDGDNKIIPTPQKSFKWRIADNVLERESHAIKIKDFFYIHPINIMGLFINKQKAIEIGGFDNTWDPTSDYIFILNLCDKYQVRCTDKKLLNYRQAVNASLSPKHLIGMVEVDAFMRKDINRHIKVMEKTKADRYRSALILNHEDSLINNWFSKLDQQKTQDVQNEYSEFNKFMKVIPITDEEKMRVIKRQGYYSFWMRFFRI